MSVINCFIRYLFLVGVCAFTVPSEAASLTTYRIFLDSQNPQTKFKVKSSSGFPEKCDIHFTYRAYEDGGTVKKLTPEQEKEFLTPALARFRYSPKSFTLQPKTTQYVTFRYRRLPNDQAEEYRTYANIACFEQDPIVPKGVINLKPALVHAVPMVIRTGNPRQLDLDLTFDNVSKTKDGVSFDTVVSGNRSIFGDLWLVDKDDNRVEVLQRNAVVYQDMGKRHFSFRFAQNIEQGQKVIFEETGVKGDAAKKYSLEL